MYPRVTLALAWMRYGVRWVENTAPAVCAISRSTAIGAPAGTGIAVADGLGPIVQTALVVVKLDAAVGAMLLPPVPSERSRNKQTGTPDAAARLYPVTVKVVPPLSGEYVGVTESTDGKETGKSTEAVERPK